MIYFIGNKIQKIVKIGYTTNVTNRIKSIQTGSAYKLEIFKVIEGDFLSECGIHNKWKEYKLEGEWFTLTPGLENYIDTLGGIDYKDKEIAANYYFNTNNGTIVVDNTNFNNDNNFYSAISKYCSTIKGGSNIRIIEDLDTFSTVSPIEDELIINVSKQFLIQALLLLEENNEPFTISTKQNVNNTIIKESLTIQNED